MTTKSVFHALCCGILYTVHECLAVHCIVILAVTNYNGQSNVLIKCLNVKEQNRRGEDGGEGQVGAVAGAVRGVQHLPGHEHGDQELESVFPSCEKCGKIFVNK